MLNWLVPTAHAQSAAAAPQGGEFIQMGMIAFLFIVFYFLIIRPQNKRRKETEAMLSALTVGDEVSTNAGILGKVKKIDESYVIVNVANNVDLKFQKVAILGVLPKGTLKAIE